VNRLEPLPYHRELRDYLQSRERDVWKWFASAQAQADYTEQLRLQLLKSTYRLDAEGHPGLFQAVEVAKSRLHLDIPVTVYQASGSPQPNAALYFTPGEGHLVFSGPILSLLDPAELLSVVGHELAHHWLWQWEQGDLLVVDRLLQAAAGDPRAAASHAQTARRFQLYTEIFADRGSLVVTDAVDPVVSGLVKIQTGLRQVSAAAYLRQAEEIFSRDDVTADGLSHPEAFIRARALALWRAEGEASYPGIRRMIEGPGVLDDMDLVGQARMQLGTRRLLEQILRPRWMQTPAALGHARLYFGDLQPATAPDESVWDTLRTTDPGTREYLCHVLLDFVTADPELDEMPLAAALVMSRRLEIDGPFEKLATRELKLKTRDLRRLKENAAEMLAQAEGAR